MRTVTKKRRKTAGYGHQSARDRFYLIIMIIFHHFFAGCKIGLEEIVAAKTEEVKSVEERRKEVAARGRSVRGEGLGN